MTSSRALKASRLVVWLGVIMLAAAFARADVTVLLKFDPLPAAPPQAERNAILAGMIAKYAFEPNIHFTLTVPPGGVHFVINFVNGAADVYGDSNRPTRTAWVYRKNHLPGTDHHAEGEFFDTQAKREAGMIDTAAHELGHLLGCEHNHHAPNDHRKVTSPDGNTSFPRKHAGDGTLVNGKPGLMCDGHHVLPDEAAAGGRDFSPEEKAKIHEFLVNFKPPNVKTPDARRGNTTSSKSLKSIKGIREVPTNPTPPFPDEAAVPRTCELVDINLQFINNTAPGPGWEFGYIATDGEFRTTVLQPGLPFGSITLEPGAIRDFAVKLSGAPDTQRISFTEGNFLPLPQAGQPVDPGNSVDPVVTQPYFRFVILNFDTDNNPGTQPLTVIMTLSPADEFDGLLPVPGCVPDFNNVGGLTVGDIFDFLNAWFAGDPQADFDAPPGLQVSDVFAFLAAWFAGC